MNKTISESDILNEMVSPDVADFHPEAAKALLALHFTATAVERMNQLAEKNRGSRRKLSGERFDKLQGWLIGLRS